MQTLDHTINFYHKVANDPANLKTNTHIEDILKYDETHNIKPWGEIIKTLYPLLQVESLSKLPKTVPHLS